MTHSTGRSLLTLLLVPVTVATTGCAQLLSSSYSPGGHRYGRAYPLAVPVDPEMAARGRWDNVMRLPRGSVVNVLAMDGTAYVGPLTVVDGAIVRVLTNGSERHIPRADVLRIDLVDLPGSEVGAVARQTGIGAILGVGAAALISGVIGGAAWPPPGALLRGGAAIGGIAGGSAETAARAPRIVYMAEHQRTAAPDPGHRGTPGSANRIVRSIPGEDWPAISSLAQGELVRVVRRSGTAYRGMLIDVDENSLRIDVDGAELRVPRASIVRIEVLDMPD